DAAVEGIIGNCEQRKHDQQQREERHQGARAAEQRLVVRRAAHDAQYSTTRVVRCPLSVVKQWTTDTIETYAMMRSISRSIADTYGPYAVGFLAGVTQRVDGATGPREPSFPPTPGGKAARGGRKEEFFGGQSPPNLPTAYLLIGISNARNRLDQTGKDSALLPPTGSAPTTPLQSY